MNNHHQPRISRDTWADMHLMKSITHIDKDTCEVLVTEIRRDLVSGLTLQHTYPLFRNASTNALPEDMQVDILTLGAIQYQKPQQHGGYEGKVSTAHAYEYPLTIVDNWPIWKLIVAGMVLVGLLTALIVA